MEREREREVTKSNDIFTDINLYTGLGEYIHKKTFRLFRFGFLRIFFLPRHVCVCVYIMFIHLPRYIHINSFARQRRRRGEGGSERALNKMSTSLSWVIALTCVRPQDLPSSSSSSFRPENVSSRSNRSPRPRSCCQSCAFPPGRHAVAWVFRGAFLRPT